MTYAAFEKKIKELNAIIYNEPALIKKEFNDKQARLMQPSEYYDSIPITFYKDGLLVRRGPFRPNGTPGYHCFVRDIMEGYFPSDFRDEYPDGVILVVKDRQFDKYSPSTAAEKGFGGLVSKCHVLGDSVSLSKKRYCQGCQTPRSPTGAMWTTSSQQKPEARRGRCDECGDCSRAKGNSGSSPGTTPAPRGSRKAAAAAAAGPE